MPREIHAPAESRPTDEPLRLDGHVLTGGTRVGPNAWVGSHGELYSFTPGQDGRGPLVVFSINGHVRPIRDFENGLHGIVLDGL